MQNGNSSFQKLFATNYTITGDYKNLLERYGVSDIYEYGYYWLVGKPNQSQGWIFTIPVWTTHFEALTNKLIPYLIKNKISFIIPLNIDVHTSLGKGALGYFNIGKIIQIFTTPETNLQTLKNDLSEFTIGFKGTIAPSCIQLENLLFIKYGSYQTTGVKIITDSEGKKIEEKEDIPFSLYPWLKWPFEKTSTPVIIDEKKIFQDRYFILKILKRDVKGFVMTAIFQKNLINYRKCVIKEGKMGMFVDKYERDIQDRLLWQKSLHEKLGETINIPKLISYFSSQSNNYLVIQYIKARSLGEHLNDIFNGNSWNMLTKEKKHSIVNILIIAISAIQKLHDNKIIHRDLNSQNLLIRKDLTIYLIDLELCFDLNQNAPNPPFEKGTEGYISPEQANGLPPSFEDDIYSIGSIFIASFLNLSPYRLNKQNITKYKTQIKYFCHDSDLVDLILDCHSYVPKMRPSILNIQNRLKIYDSQIHGIKSFENYYDLNRSKLLDAINNSINTLSNPNMLTADNLWYSTVSEDKTYTGTPRLDRTVYIGFRKGINGILYLFGKVAYSNISIEDCKNIILNNWDYIKYYQAANNQNLLSGLFSGRTGTALTLYSLIKGKILPEDEENINYLIQCISPIPENLNLSDGLAGYGITLLKCAEILPDELIRPKLQLCIEHFIKTQNIDGSWTFNLNKDSNNDPLILTGFYDGMAGIIWFLLKYVEIYNDINILNNAFIGLNFLYKSSKKIKKYRVWHIQLGEKDIQEFSNGSYLILLPFIKAYSISHDMKFKELVEDILLSYPQQITTDLLSQEAGIAGLGEVYLEAWLAFKNEEWKKRAQWIAELFLNTIYGDYPNGYWLQEDPFYPSSDLLTGNGGIIHFLLRMYSSNETSSIY